MVYFKGLSSLFYSVFVLMLTGLSVVRAETYYSNYSTVINSGQCSGVKWVYAQTFYSNYSSVINSEQCSAVKCIQCPTGKFNLNCGIDASRFNVDNCVSCSNAPTNSYYLPWGPFSSVGSTSSICRWACSYRYNLSSNGLCIPGNCSIPPASFDLAPGTLWPECNTTCKAGYVGSRVVDPPTCTACAAGKYSASGATTCLNCPLGKYNPSPAGAGSVSCLSAPAGTYVSSFGSSNPTPCLPGLYLSSTGAVSDAACLNCPVGSLLPSG